MKTTEMIVIFISLLLVGCSSDSESEFPSAPPTEVELPYFPPLASDTWEQTSLTDLNWQEERVQELYQYLEDTNTKGFIILRNGKIVIEEYFNGHTRDSTWFWNSAAKSFVASIVGIAQNEGHLNIDDKTSDYIGLGWSSLTSEQESMITIKHHLSMNTGLDDKIDQRIAWTCTLPACLEYEAIAGTRWAYHQGAYSLLFDIIENATTMDFEAYAAAKLGDNIGMSGSWSQQGFLQRYQTDTRSMARFGLLILNKGLWQADTVITESFVEAMINTSQNNNLSYGYLWWLNGKESHMGTASQRVFSGPLVTNAPDDMVAALGANDQKIYVVPSLNLVIVRTGDSASESQLGPSSFDNTLWGKINAVIN